MRQFDIASKNPYWIHWAHSQYLHEIHQDIDFVKKCVGQQT